MISNDRRKSHTASVGVQALAGQQGTIRQVLLITDGCSNVGEDPVARASLACKKNITVNVIGVIDSKGQGNQGHQEAMSIADAGGGMCRIVRPVELSATAQMMTHQTMQLTLQQVVNQELKQTLGKTTDELPPTDRARVMQVVDKLEEEVRLQLVVAVDTSASMKDKMPTVREAIRDLALSLQARLGESQVAVVAFPGTEDEMVKTVQPFQSKVDMNLLETMFVARGGTPTGPAIDYAVSLFETTARAIDDDEFPDYRWTGDSASR